MMRGRKTPGGHRRSVKRDIGGDRRKRLLDLRREGADDRCLNCGGEGGGGTMDPDDWIECRECRECSGTGKAP